MRRNDKEIKEMEVIERIIDKAQICRVAMCDNNQPYIVTMNFGYKSGNFYFHSSREGKKIDILRKNGNICIQVDTDMELVTGVKACSWGMKYLSVVGQGEIEFIEEPKEKIEALDIIMEKYAGQEKFEYQESLLGEILIIKARITELTGKKSGY
ncbi:MAG: pyridoxamine 5'-phosphate oxidase family protein [Firmicutes bacterium HGW-Firmicutes-12]|jgi:hypothetical protein|nr:MAG: pyridoxamine 5'-phosphate oxidase family protein [Firmicutes bacterium HGW-Firmicutes-12]